jgi:hypothetical protein
MLSDRLPKESAIHNVHCDQRAEQHAETTGYGHVQENRRVEGHGWTSLRRV